MMIRKCGLLVALIAALAWPSGADTVRLLNGTNIDGVVTRTENGRVYITIGEQSLSFAQSEVADVEKNKKTGVVSQEQLAADAKRMEAELNQSSGLSSEQRIKATETLPKLASPDSEESNAARLTFLDMAKSGDVFRYFEWSLPTMLPYYIPSALALMAELNPGGALPDIRSQCASIHPPCRAGAIRLLGQLQDKESLALIARGLVDQDHGVRLAACYGLRSLGDKRVTPALIEMVAQADPVLQNTAQETLAALWPAASPDKIVEGVDAWRGFWAQQATSVQAPITLDALEPLVPEGVVFQDE